MLGFRNLGEQVADYRGFPPEVALVVHTAAARNPALRGTLAHNPTLLSPVWRQLWGAKRPELKMAIALVSRRLPRPDRDLVLKHETRAKVLTRLVEHNTLDPDEQTALAAGASPAIAAALLAQPWVDASLRHDLALRAGELALLRELAYGPRRCFSDAEIVDLITRFDEWGPTSQFRERSAALKLLFSRRPAVIDAILAHDWSATRRNTSETIWTAIAGAAHLTAAQAARIAALASTEHRPGALSASASYTMLALVANPSTPLGVVDTVKEAWAANHEIVTACTRRADRPEVTTAFDVVEDPDTIKWLLRRAMPELSGSNRIIEMIELVQNPAVPPHDRGRLLLAIEQCTPTEVLGEYRPVLEPLMPASPAWGAPQPAPVPETWHTNNPRLNAAAAFLGADQAAWEIMLSLAAEFEGSFEELTQLARQL